MFGDMLKKFNNSDAQNITNSLWDWKDNVFGEWGNVPKLKSIYDGYAANNDPVVPPPAPAEGSGTGRLRNASRLPRTASGKRTTMAKRRSPSNT